MIELNEKKVIARAVNGDGEAFKILYERNIDKIYNYIFYRTSNVKDAEDLTARVFYRALRSIKKYDDRGIPFSAWLYRIAHNLVANWYRDNSRKKEVPLFENIIKEKKKENPEQLVLKLEENEELLLVINKLPADRQELLVLKFINNLTNEEIGQVMGRTEGAIKSLYHRTLKALRDEYENTNNRESA